MAYDMAEVEQSYNDLTTLVRRDLLVEHQAGGIKNSEYADTYQRLMDTCLRLAMDAPLKGSQIDKTDAEVAVLDKQLEKLTADIALVEQEIQKSIAQEALYLRQTQGFDENIRQKMLDIQMNSWAMMFSSGLLDEKPAMICDDAVTDLYEAMSIDAGVPYTPGTCPPPATP